MDITVHEVLESGNVKEVVAASGGASGGADVDAAFKAVMIKLWGDKFVKALQLESSRQWLNIEHSFERAKRTACPARRGHSNLFSISMAMHNKYKEITGDEIFKSFDNSDKVGIVFDENESTVGLKAKNMDGIFTPTVQSIVNCVDGLMKRTTDVEYIFMVGGFSSSQYLTSEIRRVFGDKVKVLIPDDPALAVLKGAVMFGWRPDYITSRIARKSYGVSVTRAFDPSKHKIANKVRRNNMDLCIRCFDPFIHKNAPVELDSCVHKIYRPLQANDTEIVASLFSSDLENPVYTDEDDTRQIGSLRVFSPNTSEGIDRKFDVSFYFGKTEIKVTVKERDDPDAPERTTRISFAAD